MSYNTPGPIGQYEKETLAWVQLKGQEGMSLLRKEKAYSEAQKSMDYMDGDQLPLRSKSISGITDNRVRKIVLETVSALTDVRPIWNYETYNYDHKDQAIILNKLARGWWKNSRADRKLQSALTYSCVGGSGYLQLSWNPDLAGGGDFELTPYDPRDVIPIDPVFSDSIQDWRGVILRQRVSIESLKSQYPAKAAYFDSTDPGWFGMETLSKSGKFNTAVTTVWSTLTGKGSDGGNARRPPGTMDLMRVFIKDDSIHTGDGPRLMGDPDSNWQYTVYPVGADGPDGKPVTKEQAKLYPRGRLIVCTTGCVLYDGPNPNWHGMFPVIRFTLDPLPWSILGASMVSDLIPMQNALNEALRGAEDGIGQWVRRGIIADRNSISKHNLESLDTRKAGLRALLNPTAGEGFKIIDGPTFPTWYMEIIQFFKNEMDENSGVRGLTQLAQLNQMPAADTLDKFMDALSPLLKLRARSIEVSLGEIAEMLKVGFFQYYDAKRRIQILGKDGLSLEDFDYDPGQLVPHHLPGGSRMERASLHHRNFSFSVAPNTFLNISHTMQKMLMLQLFRVPGGAIDIYSLWESMDIPNIGPIPAENIPDRMIAARKLGLQPGPTPEVVKTQEHMTLLQAKAAEMQIMMQMQQMQMQQQQMGQQAALQASMGGGQLGAPPGMGGDGGPPPGGPLKSLGAGGGPPGGTPGRPPSGQEPPQMLVRNGPEGPRSIVSESGR